VSEVRHDSTRNLLLRSLSPDDFVSFSASLEPATLGLRQAIIKPGVEITHIWFFETAVASIVATSSAGRKSEVGLCGREGLLDVGAVQGATTAVFECFAQIPGKAWRVPVDVVQAAMAQSHTLRSVIMRYVHSFIVQIAHTALVNASHTLDQRLARWLLMTHDRIEGDDITMTHEFLSIMLGVRRAGVTTTIHKLENAGLIRSRRALITVIDRAGLERLAGDAYGIPEHEYGKLLGVDFRPRRLPVNSVGVSA